MKADYLSTFKPRGLAEKGGIEAIPSTKRVVPVAGDTAGLSEQARDIHAWLLQQTPPVRVGDIIKQHGFPITRPYGLPDGKTLRAFPLEELVDASLLYVAEDAE